MEPVGSLPYSQELVTRTYPEPDLSNPSLNIPSHLSKIHFNMVHSPTSC
jgi:hypothetical protein